jgi:uncharacterized cofD-like protein
MPHIKKVVTIGGGTGTFTVLSGLKKYPLELTAIIAMTDDGGSTGRLRDEYGVLPPGDLRQALVALADEGTVMRELFHHRFASGSLEGHSFGSILISTLEQITGNLDKALDVASSILNIRGRVVPVTLNKVRLMTELKNGKIIEGETHLDDYQLVSRFGIKRIYLKPAAKANPKALLAIREADLIVFGPGDLYTSIIPNLLVNGMGDAVRKSKAKKIFVANLMNKHGHTDGFSVVDYVREISRVVGAKKVFDFVIYNTKQPSQALVRKYADEGEPVKCGPDCKRGPFKLVGADVLSSGVAKTKKGDFARHSLIRHDSDKLAKAILKAA